MQKLPFGQPFKVQPIEVNREQHTATVRVDDVAMQVEQAPRRASLRQRGVQADGAAVDTESRGGHITLVNGEAIRYPDPSEPAQPRERHPPSTTQALDLHTS